MDGVHNDRFMSLKHRNIVRSTGAAKPVAVRFSPGLCSSVRARASVLLKKAVAMTAINRAAGCTKMLDDRPGLFPRIWIRGWRETRSRTSAAMSVPDAIPS